MSTPFANIFKLFLEIEVSSDRAVLNDAANDGDDCDECVVVDAECHDLYPLGFALLELISAAT